MAKVTKVEKCDNFGKDNPFAILHFSKAKNRLQQASVNGDNLDYLYPVDVTKLSSNRDLNKAFDDVESEFNDYDDTDINLYDFEASEIGGDNVRAYEVDGSDLQPITVFRRASYDSHDTVFARLKAQVLRQVSDGDLKPVEK